MNDINGLVVVHLQEMYRQRRQERGMPDADPFDAVEFNEACLRPFRRMRRLAVTAGLATSRIAGALLRPKAVGP